MATFVNGYISDLSPVKDNIKLRVRILRAWLQPLYNNQQVKNMEMIVMDEHRYSLGEIKPKFCMVYNAMRLSFLSNTEVDSCTDFNGSVHGFVWRDFKSITVLEKEEDGQFDVVGQVITCKMCIQNGYWGTKLYLFDGNKAISEDEYKEGVQSVIVGTIIAIQEDEGWWYLGCKACRGKVIKSTDYVDLESEMPKNRIGLMIGGAESAKLRFRLQIRVQDETGTMSLSLFNDEVQAMVGRSAYQLCEKYAKMCIQNGYWGTKLYLFNGNKAISEDEYKEVEEFRQRLFANQPSEQSENTATKISTASKNSTKDNFVNIHPIRNIAELLDVEQVQTHIP
ncbi:replication protein A 70 kDa DNA-binding subunit B, partial [Tanacetum coccineum]